MDFFEIFTLAVALSVDVFAVAGASAYPYTSRPFFVKIGIALFFGLLHGLFATAGFFVGRAFSVNLGASLSAVITLVYFSLFFLSVFDGIGEAKRKPESDKRTQKGALALVKDGVVTSLDAFAGGFALLPYADAPVYVCFSVLTLVGVSACFAGAGILLQTRPYRKPVRAALSPTLFLLLTVKEFLELIGVL